MAASRTVQRRRVGGSGSCVHVTNVVGKSSEEFPSPAERRTTGERRGGDTCLGKLSALGIIRPDCVVHEDKFSFQYPRIVPRRSLSYARVTFVYYPRRGLSTYSSSRRPTRLRFGCAVFCRRVVVRALSRNEQRRPNVTRHSRLLCPIRINYPFGTFPICPYARETLLARAVDGIKLARRH